MGSPGDLMRSTIAGEIRNSKSSAACRSRSRSGKCSAPNRATSASSEAMLCLRSSCCQDSMRQILEIDHQVVAGGVVPREPGRLGVAAPLVEGARGRVVSAGRRLDDDQSPPIRLQPVPARQREGLGTELLRAVEDRLKTDRGRLVVVETSSRTDYAPTRAFYERRGYTQAARLPGYYAPGDDLVIYLKDLTHGVLATATA